MHVDFPSFLDPRPRIMYLNGTVKLNNGTIAMHLIPHLDNAHGMYLE